MVVGVSYPPVNTIAVLYPDYCILILALNLDTDRYFEAMNQLKARFAIRFLLHLFNLDLPPYTAGKQTYTAGFYARYVQVTDIIA